jgi:hypothetical protein
MYHVIERTNGNFRFASHHKFYRQQLAVCESNWHKLDVNVNEIPCSWSISVKKLQTLVYVVYTWWAFRVCYVTMRAVVVKLHTYIDLS